MTIWSHEDPVPGIFNDGAFPVDRKVLVRQTMGELIIEDRATGETLARWPLGTLKPIPDAEFPEALRLRQIEGEGARLAIFDRAFNEGLTEWWPSLRRRLVLDRATLRTAGRVSAAAVLGLGLFFLFLMPIAGQLASFLVPPGVEQRAAAVFLRHGDPLLQRINAARVCDQEPVAPVMDKLMTPLRKASGWRGPIRLRVIDDPLPNAATIAGGEIVIFRGMLFLARNGDELAGILAHEIGHVTRRHAMRNLFVTSLNFFGFEQLLGNFSGQLVVHPVSGRVLMRREGRRAEREADRSAVELLGKAGFKVRPLADILERVGYLQGEKELAEGWLATHPLSRRRARMIRDAAPPESRPSVLTAEEFTQLRSMCAERPPESPLPSEDTPQPVMADRTAPADAAVREAAGREIGTEPEAQSPEPGNGKKPDKPEGSEPPEAPLSDWDTGGE
jgi:beta-barrel assembly-enhancing protease